MASTAAKTKLLLILPHKVFFLKRFGCYTASFLNGIASADDGLRDHRDDCE